MQIPNQKSIFFIAHKHHKSILLQSYLPIFCVITKSLMPFQNTCPVYDENLKTKVM